MVAVPGDKNYDPTVQGVPCNIVDGASSLGAKIDALTTAIGTLTTAVNALKVSVDADTAADG